MKSLRDIGVNLRLVVEHLDHLRELGVVNKLFSSALMDYLRFDINLFFATEDKLKLVFRINSA